MLVETATNPDSEEITVPEHPGGGVFSYAIFAPNGMALFTDSLVEALAQEIPGYADLADQAAAGGPDADQAADEMLGLRYDDLRVYADALQRWMVNDAAERGRIDLAAIGDQALSALMNERFVPFDGIQEPDGTVNLVWEHDVPLILFVTDYEPYTSRPQPSGQVMWVDPSTELTYLESLDTLGIVDFTVLEGE